MLRKIPLTFGIVLALSSWAHAGIGYQLMNSSETGAPGDTLEFFVTLTNTSETDQVWLNGTGTTSASPYLSIDTTPFFANAPLSLDPLSASPPFAAFDVTIDLGTPNGPYIGNIVSIQGGADGGAGTAFDELANISFDVNVQSVSTVPEPGTLGGIFAGLCAMGCLAARRPGTAVERKTMRFAANAGKTLGLDSVSLHKAVTERD